jgi:protein-tyrosine-phosphatase
MSKPVEDDLRDILDETAREMAQMYPNPRTWQSWMIYFLERLESQAVQNPSYTESFKEMLEALQDELRNRLKTGGW